MPVGPLRPTLVAVNLAVVREDVRPPDRDGVIRPTGIDKRSFAGEVWLGEHGVAGDSVCDRRVHGGPDQAVYAYDAADTAWWQQELAAELPFELAPGSFGENLTTVGLPVSQAVIGERWQVGGAVLEVSRPRIPCATFAAFWQVDKLVKRFTAAVRPGAYLRVLVAGGVRAGQPIRVLSRPDHGLTIADTFRAMTGERSLAPRLLAAPELPAAIRADARQWMTRSA